MSVLRGNVYANDETPLWVLNTGGTGGPLVSTLTTPFTDGTGSYLQGYSFTQNIAGGPSVSTLLNAVMNNFVFAPNTTYLINMDIDIDGINGGVQTGGIISVYYGDPADDGVQIAKCSISLMATEGQTATCSISFPLANADPETFKGIYFDLYQTGAYSGGKYINEDEVQMTIYTNAYAIATKTDTTSDNGLVFFSG